MNILKEVKNVIPEDDKTALVMLVCKKKKGKLIVSEIHLENDEEFGI